MDKKRYVIINDRVRDNAIQEIIKAPIGSSVSVGPGERSLDQNAKFHAICSDIAKSHMTWAGKRRRADEWKVLLVSGHTKATQGDVEFLPGLEGEFVNIRESTARMSPSRAASLITYAIAFCDTNGIHLTETIRGADRAKLGIRSSKRVAERVKNEVPPNLETPSPKQSRK